MWMFLDIQILSYIYSIFDRQMFESTIFQPQYLSIDSFPDDPIRQLISLRLKSLNDKDAQLNIEFQQIQATLRTHQRQLRKSPDYFKLPPAESQAMIQGRLRGIQLEKYRIGDKGREQRGKQEKGRKVSPVIKIEEDKNGGKKIITPYHFTKFKKSLNKFSLSCTKENEKLVFNRIRQQQLIEPVVNHDIGVRKRKI